MELSFDADSVPGESFVDPHAGSPSGESSVGVAEAPLGESSCTSSPQLHVVSVRSPVVSSSKIESNLVEFLVVPTPPAARRQPKTPQLARVLTSSDYLRGLEMKDKEKKKEEEKERKRKEREETARLKAEEKQKIREEEERTRNNAVKKGNYS